jgi:MoxR-like ATPase
MAHKATTLDQVNEVTAVVGSAHRAPSAGAPSAAAAGSRVADEFAEAFAGAVSQICALVKGKPAKVKLALVCLFARGHLLVEDVPGVGKTTLAKALAHTLGLSWRRVQFTPDLLPSDITGSTIFDQGTGNFAFRAGPIFANVLLADEVNRASPKTQAALLEAMEELQVSVDGTTYPLPGPFLVVATQNPVDHEGTFPLPASELDRFLVRLRLGYPDRASEVGMLQDEPEGADVAGLEAVVAPQKLAEMLAYPASVYVAPALQAYMVDVAQATRRHPAVGIGLSPRAVMGWQRAGRALAASEGRDFVSPDDLKGLLAPVAEHRLVLGPEAAYSDLMPSEVLAQVLTSVPVPQPGR